MKISALDWPAISALMDDALELPAEHRDRWLDALPEEARVHRDTLAQLLADHARMETLDFLQTPPKLSAGSEGIADHGTDAERTVGNYRLLRELGRGGMGTVWLAERSDGVLKRTVALKLPHPGLATRGFAERLARERDILASLAHPNIARLYDAGITRLGQPFIALEYVPGRTLIEHCDAAGLGLRARIELFQQVLAAVQYAHAHLVVHRDLKPSNVLVDEQVQVRLLDFGIAKLVVDGQAQATELTLDAGQALTPDYASPEQIGGGPISTASDVYSLGVLLYELLTGQRPYRLKRDSRAALEEAILAADPPRPSQMVRSELNSAPRASSRHKLAKQLAGDLDAIVLKALRKNPAQRYSTADAFARDLERFLHDEPVQAQPESLGYRTAKFIGRHRIAIGAGTAFVLALSAALGVALWQASVAREQARRAEQQAQVARTEAHTAEAVQTFMNDIFKANSSDQGDPLKARQTTARELLDIGTRKIDSSLQDAPAARFKILNTLAKMYGDLGIFDQAIALRRRTADLARAKLGIGSEELAHALIELSSSLDSDEGASASKERLRAITEAQQILDRRGDSDSKTRGALYAEWASYAKDRDQAKALGQARLAVNILRNFPPSMKLAQALELEAETLWRQGSFEGAEVAATEGIAVSKKVIGEHNSGLPSLYLLLAESQHAAMKLVDAEQSHRLAWEAARAVFGEDHHDTIETELWLGAFLCSRSRAEEGLRLIADTVARADRAASRGDTVISASTRLAYGAALARYGRLEKGLALIRIVADSRRQAGTAPWRLIVAIEQEAETLIDLGRYSKATQLLDEALAAHTRLGTPAYERNDILLARARILSATGHADAALEQIDAWSAKPTEMLDPFKRLLARATLRLEAASPQEAADLASTVLQKIAANPAKSYLMNFEAEASLIEGEALRRQQRPSDAMPLLRRAVDLSEGLYDRNSSPRLAQAQIALAHCHLDLRDPVHARSLLERARAIHATHRELGSPYTRALRELAGRFKAS